MRRRDVITIVFRILFYQPEIPGNTGNAIRLCANTGCELHLVEPLGFDFGSTHLRRAGLDYHDLTHVTIHENLSQAWQRLLPANVYALSTRGQRPHSDVDYAAGDVLFFGPESVGLPEEIQRAAEVTDRVRLPMLPTSRSLNLSNSTAITVYEAWRQLGYPGAT